ncbi:CDP-alcohol phosphatidyltransferase family protein [Actinomadura harenae]|uniref:CDP-alcohol phosphatidyltransferase family protein n=1 Tax=Actinomadura harenae TaxID=2483351 RepID=A0A3M2MBU2_9ACTN|nr:CDP-alcohol phosphatidyltransferase family protein [Actinomadura harenae]RMI46999.1 CDP-alcohol phosphatidyltransferase family protein [Actinomadura harenae]
MTLAVIIATGRVPGPDPIPAAALPAPSGPGGGDASVLGRLIGRLDRLGVTGFHLITRPDLAPSLRKEGHDPVECEDAAADLREISRIAYGARTSVVLLPGDLVISDEQLTRLVVDAADQPVTAVTVRRAGGRARPVRVEAPGRVVSAGSAFHRVSAPTADFPGPIGIGEQRAVQAAGVAENLADLLEHPGALPPSTALPPSPAGDDDYDALELMLVGLVRAGMPVTAQETVPELVCRRVATPEEAQAAVETAERADERRVRLRDAVKKNDGWFATYAVSSWSPLLVRTAAWFGLTPNMVTLVSAGLAALAAFWFGGGTRDGMVIGAVLFYLAFVFDCVDGQLARYTRRYSKLGAWLDAMLDRAKEYMVFAGLAAGASAAAWGGSLHVANVWILAVAALTLQTVRHMIDFSFRERSRRPAPDAPATPLTVADDPRRPGAPSGAAPAGTIERLSRATADVPGVRWAKKIIVLPIGERFAVISLTAAFGNARLTFAVLLVWGWIAGCYTLTGRLMRAMHG